MTLPYQDGLRPFLRPDPLHGREGKRYHADPDLVAAANAALALGRPLLVTGEPGCGKTDFAFAAASALTPGVPLLECHVRSDSRARDLLYHYDALNRFGDAHHGGEAGQRRAAEVREYVQLLPLGQALVARELRVVLIDEVDKAPRDLPNDLLRELDHGRFEIPEIPADAPEHPSGLRRTMGGEGVVRPFVVITSNVERQLPEAFLRRCVFFHIRFPDEVQLRDILRDRFGRALRTDRVLSVFKTLRDLGDKIAKRPATSELIDWVQVLTTVFKPGDVEEALTSFGSVRVRDPRDLPWRTVPALSCLVKLREDLELLGV